MCTRLYQNIFLGFYLCQYNETFLPETRHRWLPFPARWSYTTRSWRNRAGTTSSSIISTILFRALFKSSLTRRTVTNLKHNYSSSSRCCCVSQTRRRRRLLTNKSSSSYLRRGHSQLIDAAVVDTAASPRWAWNVWRIKTTLIKDFHRYISRWFFFSATQIYILTQAHKKKLV